ncbi:MULTISPECIES: DnaA N-terminal domain-containing protein [Bradyrhizobium]|uniref:DnaA N-terminal domain-containing protein n=1 Tax=Bradyrhizobium TaxID=374 RepID=UPI0012FE0149|nr:MULTISPECIES: DnaA N-terminal domain-containing protein [Bradyrhizobium]MBR0947238.1 hypothetical protein [Bradyrhizobium liaoningense]MBR1034615.1 hypothetical protein [Bradyrhizobium liaoningense]MDI2078232.1 DnaA N-terminal domain-containing protein [Bradyrhizobium sp. Mp27]
MATTTKAVRFFTASRLDVRAIPLVTPTASGSHAAAAQFRSCKSHFVWLLTVSTHFEHLTAFFIDIFVGVLMYVFSETQNYAIQARLNFILGAKKYDTYFLGIQCAAMSEGLVVVYVQSEFTAHAITERYSTAIAIAVESVIHEPVSKVTVLARQNQAR